MTMFIERKTYFILQLEMPELYLERGELRVRGNWSGGKPRTWSLYGHQKKYLTWAFVALNLLIFYPEMMV